VISSLPSRLLIRASRSDRLRGWARRSSLLRRAVRRYLPGEDLSDALDAAERLSENDIGAILTCLGEEVETRADAREVREHYLGALEASGGHPADPELSVKPTHLGLEHGRDLAREGAAALAEASNRRDRTMWLDMESSRRVDPTLALHRELRRRGADVGVCLQAYLRRTGEDLDGLLDLEAGLDSGGGIRLVKGAYDEPAEVAFPRKERVDDNFLRLSRRMLQEAGGGLRMAFATHDRGLQREVRSEARSLDVEPGAYEFQMLYGVEEEAQRELAREGEAVRVLVSYGDHWFPWYMRRLAERPANLVFVLRQALPG